ncbi:MAG: hypothetical protein C4581_09660 [Nitrospiraceae bacterium]|nr:MAG: hypothetical protein C4581_09660 [Nitrospiraceae bacterium]
MTTRWQSVFILIICLYGCSSVPFQKTAYVPLQTEDPWKLVEHFSESSPADFQVMNTIVFEYNWNKFSAIGYIYVDTVEKTFRVVCMNPMGVKLFELSGDKDRIVPHFVLEQFSRKGNFAVTVGEDIKRIYFDLIPSADARVSSRRHKVTFSEPAGAGTMEYIYAGAGGYLVEKNYYEDSAMNWGISYYEYMEKNGRIYPGGIILNNYKYSYSLTVRLKEVQT